MPGSCIGRQFYVHCFILSRVATFNTVFLQFYCVNLSIVVLDSDYK